MFARVVATRDAVLHALGERIAGLVDGWSLSPSTAAVRARETAWRPQKYGRPGLTMLAASDVPP